MLHTSGTTSKPKTVPILQRNLVASTAAVADTYALTGDDVTMCVMPLFHVHGLVATVLATLSTGGTVLLPRFRPSTFWDDAARYGATWYTAVPTIHARLLTRAQELPAPPKHLLRFVRSCSAPLPTVLWQRYEEAIGVPLVEAYGMTEAAHQMASNPLPPGERRPGTVGRATGIEIVALDESWQPVQPGDEGEVAVRGPSVVDEYLDNPAATAAAFRDGWFRTGDVGKLSADGYLSLVGRVKELINRAGEKISPYEVEDVLLAHPAVAEAAAYPVPDEKYGEQVGVVIVLRGEATPRELTAYCAERLAAFKRPARVTILPEIPKGPTGKIQRRNLAALVGRMRVAVVGAGAIGAYVGAALHRGGTEVHLLARGAHLAAMRERGVTVLSPRGDFRAHPHATDDPAEIGPVDIVFLGLKAYSYADAGPLLAPLLRQGTGVVAAQNGIPWWYFHGMPGPYEGRRVEAVDPGGAVSAVIPPRAAIGCVVYCSAEIDSPGVIRHVEGTRFSIGEPDGTISQRCTAFSQAMVAGGLKCPVEKDLRSDIWLKLLGNVAFNPVSVLTRATMGEIARHPGTRQLVLNMMYETAEIAARLGSPPKISVERRFDGAAKVGDHKTSMLMDFEAGQAPGDGRPAQGPRRASPPGRGPGPDPGTGPRPH